MTDRMQRLYTRLCKMCRMNECAPAIIGGGCALVTGTATKEAH